MQSETPDSTNPRFRLKVAITGLVLSAALGSLHGQALSEAEARRANPARDLASTDLAWSGAAAQDAFVADLGTIYPSR